ncbi:MAG: sporulation protein YabP [Lachnospira sp.]|jgi:sporulation protein YabP|nr:sporulation protein YabP [Lachnospira sp.]
MEGNIKHAHKVSMSNRSKLEMTGISDVVSFDLTKVLLESDYGVITIKGQNLHVNRLSVEKGELDIDGTIQAIEYSDKDNFSKKGESWFGKLLK